MDHKLHRLISKAQKSRFMRKDGGYSGILKNLGKQFLIVLYGFNYTNGQEPVDTDLSHQRIEFIMFSYSHEEPYRKETVGLDGFSSFNLKLSIFPSEHMPLGLRVGFSFREINRTPRIPRYIIPENSLGVELVDFQNYNLFTRSYLQLVYAPKIKSNRINPYLSAGIARGRIKSGFNLEEQADTWQFWYEQFEGIRSSSSAFRGELGVSSTTEDGFMRFYAGITWFRSFRPMEFLNVSERQTCTAYTNGNIICPEFENAETFSVVSNEIPFYVAVPKYESIINMIGFQISVAFCVPNKN